MTLEITKHSGKPHVILYRRNNGSCTWMKAEDFFVRHDISHYVIEKTLGYTTAFMGMLNNGMDVRDFESREKRLQMTITAEACYAENMANLFLINAGDSNFGNFNKVLAASFTNMNEPVKAPVLTDPQLEAIKKYLNRLLSDWNQLVPGETMILKFDL